MASRWEEFLRQLSQADTSGVGMTQAQLGEYIKPQQVSQITSGMTPVLGDALDVAYLGGYEPTYASPEDLMPSRFEKTGPSLLGNLGEGNYGAAALQGMALLPFIGAGAIKGVNNSNRASENVGFDASTYTPNKTGPQHSANLLPQYRGAAVDRTEHTLLRYPPKAPTRRLDLARNNIRNNVGGIKDKMNADVQRGLEMGGADWYNTEELRDWFVRELGPEQGHAEWSEFMDLMGATSTGAKVPANIGVAAYYRNKGPEWIGQNMEGLLAGDIKPPKGSGYGHKMQGNHAKNVGSTYSGAWEPTPEPGVPPGKGSWKQNPKPRGFGQSLKGGTTNIAADLHFTRYMGMAANDPDWLTGQASIGKEVYDGLKKQYGKKIDKYVNIKTDGDGKQIITFNAKKSVNDGVVDFDAIKEQPAMYAGKPNDNEYKDFEDLVAELAKEQGLTGPQYQAALWMGAADRTGVDPTSQGTFMDLFRRRLEKRAAETGQSVDDVLQKFIRERGLIALGGGVAAGGAMRSQRDDEQPRLGVVY